MAAVSVPLASGRAPLLPLRGAPDGLLEDRRLRPLRRRRPVPLLRRVRPLPLLRRVRLHALNLHERALD